MTELVGGIACYEPVGDLLPPLPKKGKTWRARFHGTEHHMLTENIPSYSYRVHLFENIDDLNKWIREFNRKHKLTDPPVPAAGCVLFAKEKAPSNRFMGHIGLCRQYLTVDIISHEATHMAVRIAKYLCNSGDTSKRLVLTHGPLGHVNEELLCAVQGDLTGTLTRLLATEGYFYP